MTIILMACITLLFHSNVCFLKTWSAHFADALTISYFYPCLHFAVIKNLDLTNRDVKRSEISKLIPSKIYHNLTAQMEGGYPQLHWWKQTAFKELNKRGRADVNRRNCLPIYHWGTLQCQDVIHSRAMKGIRCRQNICLHSLILKQVQVGRAIMFSIRRLRSSPLNPSWVFSLNKAVKTKRLESHCALYPRVRAFLKHSQSFLRICRSHFRRDPHFTGFFWTAVWGQCKDSTKCINRRAVAILTAEHQY